MNAKLILQLDDPEPAAIQPLGSDLVESLRSRGIEARFAEPPGGPNSKGGGIDWNTILIDLITSGVITQALLLLKAYLDRHDRLKCELRAGKKRIGIARQDLTPEMMPQTEQKVRTSLEIKDGRAATGNPHRK